MPDIKVLFLASNPLDSTRLALGEEARGIERRLRASKYRDSIIFKTWWAIQPDDLLQALNEELPQVVHFCGHGHGPSGIALHDDRGAVQLITSTALARLFSAMKDNIRIVVLNACYSQEQAQAIVAHIDCVIGMSDAISDLAARKFAASFYRGIAFGRTVRNAFEQGLAAIALEVPGQEHFPVLLEQEGIDARRLILVDGKQHARNDRQVVLAGDDLQEIAKKVPNKRMQKKYGDRFLRKTLPNLAGKLRYKEKICIIILDIDELTIINKQYGRRVGNNVIAAVARILYIEGGTEYSGRCGDDTYYVLLPGYGINEAERVAEHLSETVVSHQWNSLASELRVSCTFGVSQLQRREPVRDWVIRAAIAVNNAKKYNTTGLSTGRVGDIEESQRRDKEAAERARQWAKGAGKRRRVALAPLYLSKKQSRELRDYWS